MPHYRHMVSVLNVSYVYLCAVKVQHGSARPVPCCSSFLPDSGRTIAQLLFSRERSQEVAVKMKHLAICPAAFLGLKCSLSA